MGCNLLDATAYPELIMTPAEKDALEGLTGKPLSQEQIEAVDGFLLPDRNDVGIGATLSVGRKKFTSRKIGLGAILGFLNPAGGNFLNALEAMGATDANVKWSVVMLINGDLDLGDQHVQDMFAAFAEANPEHAEKVSTIAPLGYVDDPIQFNAVSDALNVAQGKVTL